MIDAHVHLDFMANGEQVAAEAAAAGVRLLAATVTPAGFVEARSRFGGYQNVSVGLGLHPWWVNQASDAEALLQLLDETDFVSEVGLDFGKRHLPTREAQSQAFSRIADACGKCGGKTLSLHSVHAAREVIDVLEASGALETCTCIFHWFTGPSDQLKRAIDAKCRFSVGERMLATGKGREYVKAIPADLIMLETDAPPQQGQEYAFADLQASLKRVEAGIASIKANRYAKKR